MLMTMSSKRVLHVTITGECSLHIKYALEWHGLTAPIESLVSRLAVACHSSRLYSKYALFNSILWPKNPIFCIYNANIRLFSRVILCEKTHESESHSRVGRILGTEGGRCTTKLNVSVPSTYTFNIKSITALV